MPCGSPCNAAFVVQVGRSISAFNRDPSGADRQRGITGNAAFKAHICIDPELRAHRRSHRHPRQRPRCPGRYDLLASHADEEDKPEVVGDSAYGSAAARSSLEAQGYAVTAKAAPVRNSTGGFTKEDFTIDLEVGAVTCPAGQAAPVHFGRGGQGNASFKGHCRHCPLKSQCTPSHRGRTISVHPQEALLRRARAEQKSPEWQARTRQPGQLSSARSPISPGGPGAGAKPG